MLDILIIRPEFSALRQMGCLDLGVIILTKPTAISHALYTARDLFISTAGLASCYSRLTKKTSIALGLPPIVFYPSGIL